MHVTVRFISKYFSTSASECGRSVHIPVNMYDPATKTWATFQTRARDRGKDYPYNNLAKQGNPKYSHTILNENPFPKVMRQNGKTRPSQESNTPAMPGHSESRGGTAGHTPLKAFHIRSGTDYSNSS